MFPIRDANPRKRFPILTIGLILANLIIFVANYYDGEEMEVMCRLGFVPAEGFSLRKAISSMFMHGGWFHLIGNMWFLWLFGDNVEDTLGKVQYIFLYFLSGLAATGAHYLSNIHQEIPAVGASGAISGVIGAYLYLFPRAKVYVIWGVELLKVSARGYLIVWFIYQLIYGIVSSIFMELSQIPMGGIAFWAHIGGFIAGWLLAKALTRTPKVASYAQAAI